MSIYQATHTKLKGGFLFDKQQLNLKTTIQAVWDRFYDTGRIEAFLFKLREDGTKKPHIYWDSDVAKWMEGAAYILAKNDRPDLKEKMDWLVDKIVENQCDDGYFNIYYTVCEPEKRFTDRTRHELYCAGHLIEAACAYYEACGDERFLNSMIKYTDYIYKVFVEENSAAFRTPGHQEIELALIRLYRITKVRKYLDLALFFLNMRGTDEDTEDYGKELKKDLYLQSHLPIREQKEAVGHAVRALYLYAAMADAAAELNDAELKEVCETLFEDMVNKKMHITGGLGQTMSGEAFSMPYDLKNELSYTETCASIAMILFAERMFDLTHSSKYADVIETELYNGMISGLSVDGKKFFYSNPLEINLNNRKRYKHGQEAWFPITERVEVFGCSCCPPNLNRTLASIERLLYTRDGKDIYIHQFAESEYADGDLSILQSTDYPNSGVVKVVSKNAQNVFIRIPAWCRKFTLSADYEMVDGYAKVKASEFTLDMEMPVRFWMSNEEVWDNENKIAVTRGPVVYCAEAIDNPQKLHKLYIHFRGTQTVTENDYFGLPTVTLQGLIRKTDDKLYSTITETFDITDIKMIPYYGFANRGESDMRVWMNYR